MRKLMTAIMIAGFALGAAEVSGQSVNGGATVTVPTVLTVTSVTDLVMDGSGFDFTGSETATSTGTVSITTRSNVSHGVDVTGTDITDGNTVLDVEVQDASGVYGTVGGAAVRALDALASGTQTNVITYQATADVTTDAPGDYTGTLTYTVVTSF